MFDDLKVDEGRRTREIILEKFDSIYLNGILFCCAYLLDLKKNESQRSI